MKYILTVCTVLVLLVFTVYGAETTDNQVKNDLTEEQNKRIETCTHQLKIIGKAITSYKEEHGDYPEWLSELLPKHLADEGILICPADDNNGKSLHPYTIEPNKAVSYDYQLVPKLRNGVLEDEAFFGEVTPLVRCFHHNVKDQYSFLLNLSFGNKIYHAPYSWKNSLPQIYGNVETAIDVLESKLEEMPDIPRFFSHYHTLLKLYNSVDRKEDADKLIVRVKGYLNPESIPVNFTYGDMLRTMNRDDEELQHFEKLEKHHPEHRGILSRLADIHKKLGNTELAFEYRKKFEPGLAYIGKMLPDFSATDLEGEPISIESYRGKILLVDFWAVWCGPCVAEMPNVKKVYHAYKDKGFDIVGISLDSDETKLRDYLKENEIPWRQVFSGKGWDSPVSRQYGINAIPNMWLIDKEGKLISNNARGKKLEKLVAEALGEKQVE